MAVARAFIMKKSNEVGLIRETLFAQTDPVNFSVADVDLDQLRRHFARLFDRAVHAVQLAGFEPDDAIINRYLLCRISEDAQQTIAAGSLADRTGFHKSLLESMRIESREDVTLAEIRIVGLFVEAIVERWP